ncbi:hypothetical protein [Pseudomonas sp. NKUCC02_KPG]|uniref:hypothetical protein n=1 Tax=Pseudomonas sp. NKUCC02_KPG TaxID=2842124 RepID=UPI001C5ABABD|nr:hypothetical protein [Pseudomonas sp. NKUCC02_KPG]MBW3503697.1 hypothetical protein [Pseudomonas sp. NKUCC02_KPG]
MSTYWRKQFEHNFIATEKNLGLDDILQEAQDAYLGWMGASLMAFHGEIDPAKLDALDQIFNGEIPMRMAANDCFDYAINGRLRLAKDGTEQNQMNDSWGRLATVVLSARPAIEVFSPRIRGREMLLPTGLEHILLHALIRARLDLDTHPKFADEEALPMFLSGEDNIGYLTLKEIAQLGQMSERAVRNAAQPTAADRLYTRKEKNQTVVDADEALRWLKGRRGFVATRAD